jgi:hypothetical protein
MVERDIWGGILGMYIISKAGGDVVSVIVFAAALAPGRWRRLKRARHISRESVVWRRLTGGGRCLA